MVGVCYHFELFHHFGTNTFPTHQSESFKCAVDIINCEVQVVTTFVFVDTNQQSPTLVIKPFYCLKPANILLSQNQRDLKQGCGYHPVKADCFYGIV